MKTIKAKLEVRPLNKVIGYLSQVLYTPIGTKEYQASIVDHISKNDTYFLKGMFTCC